MSKSDKFQNKGSALLVVLGFLTFMIISAVSFSIYMRTERQASSNYRHSVTARHLLESALFRAIDEVDKDLVAENTKFPNHVNVPWEGGRVFTSDPYPVEEIEDARVLSLESLSFLPAALANDVRYYSTSTNAQYGAKWRRMGMPIDIRTNQVTNSGGKNYVGRYAYICVNLSDMLNINGCTAASMRSVTNLVGVASLFATGVDFEKQRTNDLHYTTLQDFYACMAEASQDYFDTPMKNSPAIEVMKDKGDLNTYFNDQTKHLFVTEGFAKVEKTRVQSGKNVTYEPTAATKIADNIIDLFPGEENGFIQGGFPFKEILEDYLSLDDEASMRLDVPSSKLTPMICQVWLAPAVTPVIVSEQTDPGTPTEKTTYKLSIMSVPGDARLGMGVRIRLCFPFKNVKERKKPYTLNVEGFVRVDKVGQNPALLSRIAFDAQRDIGFKGTLTITADEIPDINGTGDAKTDQDKCYFDVDVPLAFTPSQQNPPLQIDTPVLMATKDHAGAVTTAPGFDVTKKINVAIVIDKMTIMRGGQLVDSVPARPPGVSGDDLPKLYFQTGEASILAGSVAGTPIPYEWDCLEVPDPRFNHYVVNWMSIGRQPDGSVKDDQYQTVGVHKITRDLLLGKEGRDADIFMASSGVGTLQSVGELGFLIRPYSFDEVKGGKQSEGHVNFRMQTELQPDIDDSKAYFRTIRLYDQGGKTRDKVYEKFYMATDANGTLPLRLNARINPLTTVGAIIECALDRIPYSYYHANRGASQENFTDFVVTTRGKAIAGWKRIVGPWANSFTNAVNSENLRTSLDKSVNNIYGEANMNWYSDEKVNRQTIFGVDAQVPLYEIDRKMMYAFSLDSMSDRQQLFLYVFQAESVPPITLKGMRSLSGGRAVAFVWRDPYPPNQHKILFFKQLDN
jgi:hypothetical protein